MTEDTSVPTVASSPSPGEPTEPGSSRRRFGRAGIIALGVGALVLVVGVAVFAVAVTGAGGKAVAAEAMPPDVDVYVSVDFINLREVGPIYDAFVESSSETATPAEDLLDELDRELDSEFGVTLDDLIAWLGRDAAIGLRNLSAAGGLDAIPDVVATVSIEDNALAAEFIETVRTRVEEEEGVSFEQSEYEGVSIFAADGPTDDVSAYATLDEVLIVGSSVAMVEDAIDAYLGESLADVAEFQDTMAALPGSRALTVYLDPAFLEEAVALASELQAAAPTVGLEDAFAGLRGIGLSGGAIAEGLRFDVAIVTDPEVLTDEQLSAFNLGGGPSRFEDRFPVDTLFYVGGSFNLADAWDAAVAELDGLEEAAGLDPLLDFANELAGFDIERDLIRHLDGPTGIALVDSLGGILGDRFGFDVGLLAAFGTSDAGALGNAIDGIGDLIGQATFERSRFDVPGADGDFFVATEGGSDVVAYGAGDGFMLVASSRDLIAGFYGEGSKLAENETFRRAAGVLPGGSPGFFADIAGLLESFDAPRDIRMGLAPLQGVAAGGQTSASLSTATLVIVIDTGS